MDRQHAPQRVINAGFAACGKLILLGEHFVVHGTPALALPLLSLNTEVQLDAAPAGGGPVFESDAPFEAWRTARELLELALTELRLGWPDWRIRVRSAIPIGCGLGSSAAFSVALCGALSRAAGRPLRASQLNRLAHTLEKRVHGKPSGIDDTVVTHRQPLWFVRGKPHEFLPLPPSLRLLLASSGRPGSTHAAVHRVAMLQEAGPDRFARLCQDADGVVRRGKQAFVDNDAAALGEEMNNSHRLLRQIGVSTPELDRLVDTARTAGALGAKLTGAGDGGFMVALVDPSREVAVRKVLERVAYGPVLVTGGLP